MKKLLLLGFSAVVLLASCVKKKETAPQGEAHIRFVNAVIGSPSQDVYINEKKVVAGTLAFGTATQYLSYTSGISAMGFVDPSTGNINASENYGAEAGAYSTLFFYVNKAGYMTAGGILDNMAAPSNGKAKVRFINLHYNLNNAFIIAVQGGANLLTSLEFGAASAYFEVDPGAKFTTQAVGVTTNPVIDLNIQAGKIYNVWLSGENATEIYGHGYLQN